MSASSRAGYERGLALILSVVAGRWVSRSARWASAEVSLGR